MSLYHAYLPVPRYPDNAATAILSVHSGLAPLSGCTRTRRCQVTLTARAGGRAARHTKERNPDPVWYGLYFIQRTVAPQSACGVYIEAVIVAVRQCRVTSSAPLKVLGMQRDVDFGTDLAVESFTERTSIEPMTRASASGQDTIAHPWRQRAGRHDSRAPHGCASPRHSQE